jgi:hypothetical protein
VPLHTRHRAVTGFTLSARVSVVRTAVYLAGVWTLSVLGSLPALIFPGLLASPCDDGTIPGCCFYFQASPWFGAFVTVGMYVAPNVVVAVYYALIVFYVRRSRMRISNFTNDSNASELAAQVRRRHDARLARMFVGLCVVFNVCYLPVVVVTWVDSPSQHSAVPVEVQMACRVLIGLAPLTNAVIYLLFDSNARRKLHQLCSCTAVKD